MLKNRSLKIYNSRSLDITTLLDFNDFDAHFSLHFSRADIFSP